MTDPVERSAEWVYQGVWHMLVECFKVPRHPPSLPVEPGDFCRTFHPSRRYLSYLKMYFWVVLVVIDLAILGGWVALLVWRPWIAWIVALPALMIAIVPDIVAYVMIHLRYDNMWYVITNRSLRARRGIWVILEHTITFENVQNVYVLRGPIQHFFGISTIVLETAGATEGESENPFAVGNKAILEGIDNPEEIRELIMEQVKATRLAGLGDEKNNRTRGEWRSHHTELLREIRDQIRELA
jgi:membrane protein YdbS with pleckstrin-like domain